MENKKNAQTFFFPQELSKRDSVYVVSWEPVYHCLEKGFSWAGLDKH